MTSHRGVGPSPGGDAATEELLMGLILANPDRIGEVMESLCPEDLQDPRHVRLHSVMIERALNRQTLDLPGIAKDLAMGGWPEDPSPLPWLSRLVARVPATALPAGSIAAYLAARAARRRARATAQDLSRALADTSIAPERIEELADRLIVELDRPVNAIPRIRPASDLTEWMHERLYAGEAPGQAPSRPTLGEAYLNHTLGGLEPGDLILVGCHDAAAARRFCVSTATRNARDLVPTLLLSPATQPNEILADVLAEASGVPRDDWWLHKPAAKDRERLLETMREFDRWPLAVGRDDLATVQQITRCVRAWHAGRRPSNGLVILHGADLVSDWPHEWVARQLKLLARRTDSVLLAVCVADLEAVTPYPVWQQMASQADAAAVLGQPEPLRTVVRFRSRHRPPAGSV